MTTLREAAQQALEALEFYKGCYGASQAEEAIITALRAALAEPQTWVCPDAADTHRYGKPGHCEDCGKTLMQLAEPLQEPLPFGIEERAGVRVLYSKDGSCRPATAEEWLMWRQMRAHGIWGDE